MKTNKIAKFLCLFLAIVAMFFLVSAIVMGLWNAILPEVIGVKKVNFWQAMGVLLLSKILFGGIKGGKEKWRNWKNANCTHSNLDFNDEEHEIFKNKLKEHFGTSKFCRKKDLEE